MPLVINELQRRGLSIPVLVGGAAINRRFGYRILYTEDGSPYAPGVFYCKDAFEGLEKMDHLMSGDARPELLERLNEEAAQELKRGTNAPAEDQAESGPRRSATPPAPSIPTPPFWGARKAAALPPEEVFAHISKNELFRLSWGAKNAQGEAWQKIQADFETRLQAMKKEALAHGWIRPQAVYGYFPAQSAGNDLIIYDPESRPKPREITRFIFPRQPAGEALCLADYFSSVESGILDVAVFQVVTVGQPATVRFDQLEEAGDYAEAYFFHGLAVQTAEAAADYLHQRVRLELGLPAGQGKRYSWGYPSIPELEDHRKVFDLLPAERDLGMLLTPAFQLVPEQSTAAIILHHPAARYFGVGETRLEQLRK